MTKNSAGCCNECWGSVANTARKLGPMLDVLEMLDFLLILFCEKKS